MTRGSRSNAHRDGVLHLTLPLAVASALAGLLTILAPGLLSGPPVMNGSARGTALVVVLVAVPSLVAGVAGARRGSVRGLAVATGATAYLVYNAVLFVFATPFNRGFLVYEAMLGLAISPWPRSDCSCGTESPRSRRLLRDGSACSSGPSWGSTCWSGCPRSSRPCSTNVRGRCWTGRAHHEPGVRPGPGLLAPGHRLAGTRRLAPAPAARRTGLGGAVVLAGRSARRRRRPVVGPPRRPVVLGGLRRRSPGVHLSGGGHGLAVTAPRTVSPHVGEARGHGLDTRTPSVVGQPGSGS